MVVVSCLFSEHQDDDKWDQKHWEDLVLKVW